MDDIGDSLTYPQATSSNTEMVAVGDTPSEPVQAYAKLEGDSFCYYIRTLQVTFGRKASSSDHVDIHLGPTKAISRQHARLFYNFTTQRFEMMVFGKNGAFVNDQFVEKGVTVPLENRTKIQIGEVSFSFLLPKIETDDPSLDQGSSQRNGGVADQFENNSIASNTLLKREREASSQSTDHFDSSEYSSRDTKPPFSYASLIAQAINSTLDRRLTLNGIYQYITQHYPYYQMAHNGWQNSIRHNLSLNKAFLKVPRADSEPGKGAFWTIDQSCESQFANGVYKRNRRIVSSKPAEGRSESPMDGENPRKRINLGPNSASSTIAVTQSSTLSTLASGTQQQHQPDLSQISEASLKLAALLQQNPGLLALNLATLTQSLSAADKETAQNAILSALVAAARATNAKTGQTTSSTSSSSSSPATSTLTPLTGTSSSPASGITQQSLATLQAVAEAIAAARSTITASNPSVTTGSPPLTTLDVSSSTLSGTGSVGGLGLGLGTILSTVSSPVLPQSSAAASPIAQLVAAAQAQAAIQARMFAQAQAQTQTQASSSSSSTTCSTRTGSTLTSISTTTSTTTTTTLDEQHHEKENTQAQVLALQALAQAQQAQEAENEQEEEEEEEEEEEKDLSFVQDAVADDAEADDAEADDALSAVALAAVDSTSSTMTPLSQTSDTSDSADGKDTSTIDTNV